MGVAVEKKGPLTPAEGIAASGQNAASRTRRTDARRGLSEKVVLRAVAGDGDEPGAIVATGFAVNISRSGVRAIFEESVKAGAEYVVTVGDDGTSQLSRRVRVVWIQDEHDGMVVGLEFTGQSGLHKAVGTDEEGGGEKQ